jgi:hypothetical protein
MYKCYIADMSSVVNYLTIDSLVCWCCRCAGRVCTESEFVSSCVTCFVTMVRAYSGLGSLVFCSSINKFCCITCMWNDSQQFIKFLYRMLLIIVWYVPDFHIGVCYWECAKRYAETTLFVFIHGIFSRCLISIDFPVWPTCNLLHGIYILQCKI